MHKNLLLMVMLLVILTMAVPFTMYVYQTENAFTYDNVINNQFAGNAVNTGILP